MAIASGSVPAPTSYPTLRVAAEQGGWACEAGWAADFTSRLFGLRCSVRGGALLLRASSIHTIWMRNAITVVFIDRTGSIVAVRPVPPRRVVGHRAATWVLEIDGPARVPAPGTMLRLLSRT